MERKILFWLRLCAGILVFWSALAILGVGSLIVIGARHQDNGTCATAKRLGVPPHEDCP